MNPSLAAALSAAAARIAPERIDQVWLFPARQSGPRETALAVLSVYAEGEAAAPQRTIHTVRYRAEQGKDGRVQRTDEVAEQGTVPPDRVDRIIEGVLRRLDEAETPDVRETGGDPRKWAELLAELSGTVLDPSYQE